MNFTVKDRLAGEFAVPDTVRTSVLPVVITLAADRTELTCVVPILIVPPVTGEALELIPSIAVIVPVESLAKNVFNVAVNGTDSMMR